MTGEYSVLHLEAQRLAQQFFEAKTAEHISLTARLLDICRKAEGKDFILIHNPGGWGDSTLEQCMQWERSIVDGVSDTVQRLGYSWLLIQYFRAENGFRGRIKAAKEQLHFFALKAKVMAAELKFMLQHLSQLRIIMIGVSQGAGFGNAVMSELGDSQRVYSIEVGAPFFYRSRMVTTERTLPLDSNGLMPDALMEWNAGIITKAYLAAPFRWIKYQLQGNPVKFARCINVPGHDYNWDYPEVRHSIKDFLDTNFGTRSNLEVGSHETGEIHRASTGGAKRFPTNSNAASS